MGAGDNRRCMEEVKERIRRDAVYLGNGIVKVGSFLNHQIDPKLANQIGKHVAQRHAEQGITKILTAEVSGIPPALATGIHMNLPVIYARKGEPVTLGEAYREKVMSRTGGQEVVLKVDRHLLSSTDRVLIVDDFLARGATLAGLCKIVRASGAQLVAVECVVEKPFEGGRKLLAEFDVPIHSLACIEVVNDQLIVS